MVNFVNNLNADELMDITDKVFDNAKVNFEAIFEESDEEDSDYISDLSENNEYLHEDFENPDENFENPRENWDINDFENLDENIENPRESLVNKSVVLSSEIFALYKQCVIYSYFTIDNSCGNVYAPCYKPG